MRVAVVWPRPRRDRWRLGQTNPHDYPDLSDGLLFLEDHQIQVTIEESLPFPWNPLVRMHEFYSGLDPVRAARIAARATKYDAVLCIGDATAYLVLWLRRVFGFRTAILLIDPALSPGYARRKRLQDYVIPQVDGVVVYGRVQLDHLAQEYGSAIRASFLYHRADVNFYTPSDQQTTAADPYVFSVGLDESRDFETLAAAARYCRDDLGMTERFVLRTPRSVTQPGGLEIQRDSVSYGGLRDLYRGASVVVLPLRDRLHAGGINTLLEAMATGRPVVVSASRGIADYVRDGETVRVVAPGDVRAMSRAIAELIADPREARRLGDNARRFVVERCENRVYAGALAPIIRDIVDSRRRNR
jgi:glycosyltransferase involved in cell wall biosynthesis